MSAADHKIDTTELEAWRAKGAHTPGPWRVTTGTGLRLYVEFMGTKDLTATQICTIQPEDQYREAIQVALANARLIAAAPELLATLQAVDHEINQTYDGTGQPQITWELWTRIQVMVAIAKTTGVQS